MQVIRYHMGSLISYISIINRNLFLIGLTFYVRVGGLLKIKLVLNGTKRGLVLSWAHGIKMLWQHFLQLMKELGKKDVQEI